ncbi:MAG: prepilin-type N-terminal cleavage/methylation domain-containing protein [Burkholderiales bacterium]
METRRNALCQIRNQAGFSLIEGLIAIALFSFGVLAIMGMQAQGIKHAGESKYRIDASFLANQIVGQMWADRKNLGSYSNPAHPPRAVWDQSVSNTLPSGVGTVQVIANQVTVTVLWQVPGQSPHRYVAIADINGS